MPPWTRQLVMISPLDIIKFDQNTPFPSLKSVFYPPGQASKYPPGHSLAGGVCSLNGRAHSHVPYSRKYWQELNLAVEPKIVIYCKNIGGFKFGSLVRDHHT